jgi:uncharacterized protein (DUF1330 family)
MTTYLTPSMAAGRALIEAAPQGPVVMLNLLRFRALADYSEAPHLAPATPVTGAEAFEAYVAHTLPFLTETGGAVLFRGSATQTGGAYLIGPEAEPWDHVMLVRQNSLASFLSFNENPAYLAGLGHRTAALADSRLLPLSPADQTAA